MSSLYGEPAGQSGWYYGEASLPPLLPFFLPRAFSAPGHRQKPPASISKADKTLGFPAESALPFLVDLS